MEASTQNLENAARSLKERVGPQLAQARRRFTDANERVIDFIKERPGTCLLGALAVGWIIGRIARR